MIAQLLRGTGVRQLFVSDVRLVIREGPVPPLLLELDIQANDPEFTQVRIELAAKITNVNLIKREYDAKSE